MARRFFYVSASILMLALTYHLGATTASGQSGRRLFSGDAYGVCGVDDLGALWMVDSSGGCAIGPIQPPRPGRIIDVAVGASGCNPSIHALYDDGDLYRYENGSWSYRANVFGGAPTTTASTTMGRVKDRYRR